MEQFLKVGCDKDKFLAMRSKLGENNDPNRTIFLNEDDDYKMPSSERHYRKTWTDEDNLQLIKKLTNIKKTLVCGKRFACVISLILVQLF